MKDDDDSYLWDRRGPPDPEIVRLEEALRPLRHSRFEPPELRAADRPTPLRRRRVLLGGGACGLAAAAAVALWWRRRGGEPSGSVASGPVVDQGSAWTVAPLAGAPRLGDGRASAPLVDTRPAAAGTVLETDAASRARISVGEIGQVEIDGGSRVRLLAGSGEAHRLGLERGVMHALIWAPPGQFQVETAAGVVTDLGCSYTLAVDEAGRGRVSVSSGWVGFDYRGRESLIPAGSTATLAPGAGPGTPSFPEGSAILREVAATIDSGRDPGDAELRRALSSARPVDALPLWHLLARVRPELRAPIHDRLAVLVPPPPGVTRARIVAGDPQLRDQWWDALGYGPIAHWRRWKSTTPP